MRYVYILFLGFPYTSGNGAEHLIKLGTVIHLTTSKRLIVQSTKVPRLGSLVFDDTEKVGIVKDVFGPKAHPFVSIRPKISLTKANELVGKNLFFSDNHKRKYNRTPQYRTSREPRKMQSKSAPRSP